VFGVVGDLVGLQLGTALLGRVIFAPKGTFATSDITGRVLDLAAGLLAVIIDVAGLIAQKNGDYSEALDLSILGVVLGIGAIVMDQLLEKTEFEEPLKTLDDISDVLDWAGAGIAGGTIILDRVATGGP